MATNHFVRRAGDELGGITFPWQEETSSGTFTDLDLSGGTHTFALVLEAADGTTAATITSITGADGSAVVTFAVDDLDIDAGMYVMWLTATETATGKTRTYNPRHPPMLTIVA